MIGNRLNFLFCHVLLLMASWVAESAHAATEWPVFDALKSKTFEKSPELNALRAQWSQKKSASHTALTRWLPSVDLQLSQTRSKDYSIVTSGSLGNMGQFNFTPQEVDLSRWAFVLKMPVYRRDVHTRLLTAWEDQNDSELRLRSQEGEVDWKLRQLMGQYLLQKYKVWSTGQALELGTTQLREVKLRFELGDKTKLDVLRAQVNLSSLESKKSTHEQEKKDALSRLAEYVGIAEDELLSVEGWSSLEKGQQILDALDRLMNLQEIQKTLEPWVNAPSEDLQKTLSEAGPRYLSALQEENLALSRSQQLVAEEFPDLSLQGNVNKQGPSWNDAWSAGQRSYSISMMLTIPLFASGRMLSSWNERAQAARNAEIQSEKNRERIKNEVKNRVLQARAQEKNVYSLGIQWEQQQEIARLTQKSFELGKSTMSDLLSSQNDLLQSQIDLAQAKVQWAILLRQVAWDLGVNL